MRRTLEELINLNDPALPLIREWISSARNQVEVLPAERCRSEQTFLGLQVTTRSTLGALAYETGGLLVDGG